MDILSRPRQIRMDDPRCVWHYSDMQHDRTTHNQIPAYQLYGEHRVFPDVLHCERITDRAAGLEWTIAPHRHLHLHQIFLLRSGAITLEADGTAYALSPPTVVSIPRGMVHGFRFSNGTDGYVLTVPTQELPDIFGQHSVVARSISQFITGAADDEMMLLFDRIFAEYQTPGPLRSLMIRSLATQIACHVMRPADGSRAIPSSPPNDPRMEQFNALLMAHFRQKWQVSDYASAMSVSARHLSRICVAATGRSAVHHIEATTFQEACRLLVYTRMTVASVGYQLGFDDPSYFSRAFQRHIGLSPTAYRDRFDR